MERVTVYIDGYNFYYGLRRLRENDSDWQKFYWIDFVKFFQNFLSASQVLQKVCYFTASPKNLPKATRQAVLFEANKLINEERFEVIKGYFYEKETICNYCGKTTKRPEEKQTDVNISIKMMGDCVQNNTDTVILVSADSDLVPPLKYIKEFYPEKKIRIYFPPNNFSFELYSMMKADKKKVVMLEKNKVKFFNSILPDVVSKDGKSYTIPAKWKVT